MKASMGPNGKLLCFWNYKITQILHKVPSPNLLDYWADMSLHLFLLKSYKIYHFTTTLKPSQESYVRWMSTSWHVWHREPFPRHVHQLEAAELVLNLEGLKHFFSTDIGSVVVGSVVVVVFKTFTGTKCRSITFRLRQDVQSFSKKRI